MKALPQKLALLGGEIDLYHGRGQDPRPRLSSVMDPTAVMHSMVGTLGDSRRPALPSLTTEWWPLRKEVRRFETSHLQADADGSYRAP